MILTSSPYLVCDIKARDCTVIEAAAGTGKTYNITNIVARIIMERSDISIDKMVIVTFTRAAAGELKTRISQRLAKLEKDVQLPGDPKDELLQKACALGIDKKEIRQRLRLALLNFDRAMIGTIHSFAMRALSENSFNSKLQFEFTLNEGTPALVNELCNDFYRSFFYDEANICLKEKLTLTLLTDYCSKRLANPDLKVVWPDFPDIDPFPCIMQKQQEIEDLKVQLTECKAELEKINAEYQPLDEAAKAKQQIKKDLEDFAKTCLPRTPERKKANEEAAKAKEEWYKAKDLCAPVKEKLDQQDQKRKDIKTDIKALEDAVKTHMEHMKKILCEKGFEHIKSEYERISKEKNFLGNDDLILKMGDALEDEGFLKQMQESFPVGLIDEFQDTNDSQFKIFRKIFLDNPQSTFLVVGDPRQAIYRFRNCDIKTYLDARELMCNEPRQAKCFSMNTNRRSGAKYIDALNAIFAPETEVPRRFAMEGMDMPRQFAVEGSQVLLDRNGQEVQYPIECALAAAAPRQKIFDQCAADICNLVNAGFQIPPDDDSPIRPVAFGDIAILVNSWKTAASLRDALQKRGIPARLVKNPNVFATPEARHLSFMLEGILDPNNKEVLLRAAITPLCDFKLSDINSETAVDRYARTLLELNSLWHKRSFMLMFNELLTRFNVPVRFSEKTGGDRSLSNLNTIADILGEEAFTRKLTPSALLNSLQKHIDRAEKDEKDSFPGHAETDEGTVLIDTVFGSKGLSYPLVFLPELYYVSKSFNSDRIHKTYHDARGTLCYAPLITEADKAIEHDEMIQENLRKAYVAFTRAKYYCRFYYGSSGDFPRSSAIDWLFRQHEIREYSGLHSKLKEAAKSTPELTFPEKIGVPELIPPLPGSTCTAPPAEKLRRSDLFPDLLSQSGFLSFSSITPHSGFQSSLADDDEDEAEGDPLLTDEADEKPLKGTCQSLQLPAGTNFGNAIHKIMEICDFRTGDLSACTASQLRIHGMQEDETAKGTCEMLQKLLAAPIADADGGHFTLADIAPERKKSEFEFLYEFSQSFSTRKLFNFAKAYFEKKFGCTCPESTDVLSYYDAGFFNGSIDLFFEYNGKYYIVDWKTNLLKKLSDYSEKTLPAAMAGSRYYIQYMIYTAALFKYLKQRLPAEKSEEEFYNKYMGGIRYLFVRGVYNEDGHGIFCDRLPYETYKQLESIIG